MLLVGREKYPSERGINHEAGGPLEMTTHRDTLRTILTSSDCRFDVWRVGAGMEALLLEGEHTSTDLR